MKLRAGKNKEQRKPERRQWHSSTKSVCDKEVVRFVKPNDSSAWLMGGKQPQACVVRVEAVTEDLEGLAEVRE